jgi:hypothetical protein
MDDVRALMDTMLDVLDMREWRVTSAARPTDDAGNMADVSVVHSFREAHINWSSYLFSDDPNIKVAKPWQVCVIHELLHCRLGVYREYVRQAAHSISQREDKLDSQLVCNLAADLEEAAVEQAAWAIWKLYRRPLNMLHESLTDIAQDHGGTPTQ